MLLTFDNLNLFSFSSATATSSVAMTRGVMDILVDEADAGIAALELNIAEMEAAVRERTASLASLIESFRKSDLPPEQFEDLIEILRNSETQNLELDTRNVAAWARMMQVLEKFRPQLLARVRPLFARAESAALQEAKALRDARWEVHAMLADRDPTPADAPRVTPEKIAEMLNASR